MKQPGASSRHPKRVGKSADAVRPGPPIDSVLRLILAQMPAVVWATDAELRFTHSEGGGLAGLGIAQNEVVGIDLFRYFGTEDPMYLPITAHLDAAGEPQTHGRVGGATCPPPRAAPGARRQIVGVVGTSIDITTSSSPRDRRETPEALGRSGRLVATSRLGSSTRRRADGGSRRTTTASAEDDRRRPPVYDRRALDDPDARAAIFEVEDR
jgi:PAS domain-containing protein